MRIITSTGSGLVTLLLVAAIAVQSTGCGYGIVGKKTAQSVDKLDDNLVASLGNIRGDAMDYLKKTRDTLFDFIKGQSRQEAHDVSVGILEGTIGYLDSAQNRDALAQFLETMITHTGSAARQELIAFRDQLLDEKATGRLQYLLQSIMHELVLRPADNLLTLALGNPTQTQLNKLLFMVIPAVLNDSAIGQIGKLRTTLLGYSMKKDIASWVDTALLVANHRLDSTLRPTIKGIIAENSSTVKKNAVAIIIGLGILAVIVGLIIYYVQRKKVLVNQRLLHNVTYEIEKMRRWAPDHYTELTHNIQDAMQSDDLETRMNTFLKEKKIS